MYVAALIRFGPVVVAALLGWYVGNGLATARYETQLHEQAVAYSNAQNAAIEAANRAAEAERKRAVSAAEKRSSKAAAAQGVTHEIAADTNLDCEWREPHRVRIEALYGAYGYAADGTPAAGVPD